MVCPLLLMRKPWSVPYYSPADLGLDGRIADIVSEAGSGFAFPSQTAYLARDAGLDDERKDAAETRVGQQRAVGKLPFPEFEEEDRERLEDILDYPPKGSSGYQSRSGVTEV